MQCYGKSTWSRFKVPGSTSHSAIPYVTLNKSQISYIYKMLWRLEMRSFGEKSPVICVLHAAADPDKWQCFALGLGPSGAHKGAWPTPDLVHLCLQKPQEWPQAEACLSLKKELRWTNQGGVSNSWGAQVPKHIKFSKQVLPILLRIQSFVTD